MNTRLAASALMLGNFVTGMAVLAPAGLLPDLVAGLSISVREAGLLIAWGGLVLCIGSPLVAWATSAMDRRLVLTVSLAAMAIGQAVSALVPDYASLMAARLVMLALAAIFTPAAAGAIALIVGEAQRARSIAFVFLGWSMASAAGLPLIAAISSLLGWRWAYAMLALVSAFACAMVAVSLKRGLRGTPISLAVWGTVLTDRRILLVLSVTLLWAAGFYVVFPYLGALAVVRLGGGVETAAILFAAMGIMGFVGNVAATRAVGPLGPYRTGIWTVCAMLAGATVWVFAGASVWLTIAGTVFFGLGTASTNSMIQARLVAIAPAAAGATVALNTSWLYVGQAGGSWLGGELIARDHFALMSVAAAALLFIALVAMILSRDRASASR